MDESYKALIQQRQDLDARIAQAREKEVSEAIARVRATVDEFGLTAAEVFGARRATRNTSTKVAPKYRDPQTGKTWTGRGKPPSWIAGKERDQFLIG